MWILSIFIGNTIKLLGFVKYTLNFMNSSLVCNCIMIDSNIFGSFMCVMIIKLFIIMKIILFFI